MESAVGTNVAYADVVQRITVDRRLQNRYNSNLAEMLRLEYTP